MAEGYNVPKDQGYSVGVDYTSATQNNSTYGGEQSLTLQVYSSKEEKQFSNKKSKCPRGAILGQIGSCCGNACTRACAVDG